MWCIHCSLFMKHAKIHLFSTFNKTKRKKHETKNMETNNNDKIKVISFYVDFICNFKPQSCRYNRKHKIKTHVKENWTLSMDYGHINIAHANTHTQSAISIECVLCIYKLYCLNELAFLIAMKKRGKIRALEGITKAFHLWITTAKGICSTLSQLQ